MPTDVLILAGIVFDSYSTPRRMMGGGNQAMVVHKLPGGSRTIDTLGPDEADILWDGEFFSNNAYSTALALEGVRAGGQVVPLIWGGQTRLVIVSQFIYHARRFPNWVEYSVVCTVYQNPGLGSLAVNGGGIDALVASDLAAASSAASGGVGGNGL